MATELNLDLLKPFSNKDLDTSDASMEDPLAQELDNDTDPKKKKKPMTLMSAAVVDEGETQPLLLPLPPSLSL